MSPKKRSKRARFAAQRRVVRRAVAAYSGASAPVDHAARHWLYIPPELLSRPDPESLRRAVASTASEIELRIMASVRR